MKTEKFVERLQGATIEQAVDVENVGDEFEYIMLVLAGEEDLEDRTFFICGTELGWWVKTFDELDQESASEIVKHFLKIKVGF